MQNSQQVAGSIHYSPLLTALLTALAALTARVYLMTKFTKIVTMNILTTTATTTAVFIQ